MVTSRLDWVIWWSVAGGSVVKAYWWQAAKFAVPLLFMGLAGGVDRPPLARTGANPEAPEEVAQFGRFEGDWSCRGTRRQADGKWMPIPGEHVWSWYYVLDGYGVADVWRPDRTADPHASGGLNLRVYDPKAGLWDIVWTTQEQPRLDRFRAAERDGAMHLHAERPGSDQFDAHLMHITFHNIGPRHFDWKYEVSGLADGQQWRQVQRLSCDRVDSAGAS
jgi:hypothetical protein